MSWTIFSWDPEKGTGTIGSPHFPPVPFDASANVQCVTDFRLGEPVLVELAGSAPGFIVERLLPTHERQPPGTEVALFREVNGQFSDIRLEAVKHDTVTFWMGACCEHCTPNAPRLIFEGVHAPGEALDDELYFDDPLFRAASEGEIVGQRLHVPEGSVAYCIVTEHGQGPDGRKVFLAARNVRIAH